MKCCKQCGIELTPENKYGDHQYCKPCYRPIHQAMADKWLSKHPEKRTEYNNKAKIRMNEIYKSNPEFYNKKSLESYYRRREKALETMKRYWLNNKEERHIKQKEWREANAEMHREAASEYYYNNKEHVLTRMKQRLETKEGKEARRKVRQSPTYKQKDIIRVTKRYREMGFNPLNNSFDNSEAHHLDKVNVVYIPYELHRAIPHSQDNNESMNKINVLAFDYMGASVL